MQINIHKSTLSIQNLEADEQDSYQERFSFEVKEIDMVLTYLGFQLKSNSYKRENSLWLLANLEKKIKSWSYKWISRAESLVLVKSVLEAILVYWMSLVWIPKGILEKARRICFKFLWVGSQKKHISPWVKWESLAVSKMLDGWGLKKIYMFSNSLSAKSTWRLLSTNSLWTQVIL
jgi:hypothetical protein